MELYGRSWQIWPNILKVNNVHIVVGHLMRCRICCEALIVLCQSPGPSQNTWGCHIGVVQLSETHSFIFYNSRGPPVEGRSVSCGFQDFCTSFRVIIDTVLVVPSLIKSRSAWKFCSLYPKAGQSDAIFQIFCQITLLRILLSFLTTNQPKGR